MAVQSTAAEDLLNRVKGQYKTILADPPWRFQNRTGKMAPEHKRLLRYSTLDFEEIYELPVAQLAAEESHLYLWVPNALLAHGLETMRRWGYTYKTNIVWCKIREDGGPDGRGVGFPESSRQHLARSSWQPTRKSQLNRLKTLIPQPLLPQGEGVKWHLKLSLARSKQERCKASYGTYHTLG